MERNKKTNCTSNFDFYDQLNRYYLHNVLLESVLSHAVKLNAFHEPSSSTIVHNPMAQSTLANMLKMLFHLY